MFAFSRAAEPGEWALPGAFVFAGRDPQSLNPKEQLAMRQGFLGLASFGWSSFAIIATISEPELEAEIEALATVAVSRFGAPTIAHARKAAGYEFDFALSLCDDPVGTVLRVEREPGKMGWHEAFRKVKITAQMHAPVFQIVEDESGGQTP